MIKEIWKDIKGFEGLYQASNFGNIRSLPMRYSPTINILKPRMGNWGYYFVTLYKENKAYQRVIHRLIAKTFIPNPENKPQTNHKNGNKLDNSVENLEWVTASENIEHAYRTGLKWGRKKKVWQYLQNGRFIGLWNSPLEIEKTLGYHRSNIVACCMGHRKTAHKFIWKYK
jgi:hypothetical protein